MEPIGLHPVDAVRVTTLIDNATDVLMPDQGVVKRWGPTGTAGALPVIAADLAEGGKSLDFLRAEHGFSALVEVTARGRSHRILFDAGGHPRRAHRQSRPARHLTGDLRGHRFEL